VEAQKSILKSSRPFCGEHKRSYGNFRGIISNSLVPLMSLDEKKEIDLNLIAKNYFVTPAE
jgi:hypothetical protein